MNFLAANNFHYICAIGSNILVGMNENLQQKKPHIIK